MTIVPDPGADVEGERRKYPCATAEKAVSSTAPLTQPDFHRYEDYSELVFKGP